MLCNAIGIFYWVNFLCLNLILNTHLLFLFLTGNQKNQTKHHHNRQINSNKTNQRNKSLLSHLFYDTPLYRLFWLLCHALELYTLMLWQTMRIDGNIGFYEIFLDQVSVIETIITLSIFAFVSSAIFSMVSWRKHCKK